MPRILNTIAIAILIQAGTSVPAFSSEPSSSPAGVNSQATSNKVTQESNVQAHVESLEKPLYSPFVERYVLDELKQLRTEMASQRSELIQRMVDRELSSVDRGVTYATNTITYFFYLIAGVSSLLVLVGWTSIRDIKEKVQTLADEKISKLVNEYEGRLRSIEQQLNQKTQHIEENREEIEVTREVQALWLRAAQEHNPQTKISTYDQILKVQPNSVEALTYKADAVLELDEPQWAINLCHQALQLDADNSHAFYQLACAFTTADQFEEAVQNLQEAISRTELYQKELLSDPALKPLHDYRPFRDLLHLNGYGSAEGEGEDPSKKA